MYANQQIEQLDRKAMQALQLERLKKQVKWAQEKSFFYQQKFSAARVSYKDIQSLADIERLPLISQNELYGIDALDMLTMPVASTLRFAVLPKEPRVVTRLYTNGDIAHNIEMMARALVAAGVNNTSVVAIQGDMSDTRLMDVQYALEFIGATVVTMGMDYRQWLKVMNIVSMDTLISTQQIIMQLIIQLQSTGENIANFPINKVLCLNETAIQNPMQRHLAMRTQANVYSLFAQPEIGTASMLFQCEERNGFHINEDFFYPEIVDFNGSEIITEPNRMGELVITTLMAEAMPLVRYRTGQSVMLESEPCKCGRTLRRVATPFSFM